MAVTCLVVALEWQMGLQGSILNLVLPRHGSGEGLH